jgi:hypothetical protein
MLSLALAPRAKEVNMVREREATLPSSALSGYIDASAIWMFGKGTILYGRSLKDNGPGQVERRPRVRSAM